MMNPQISTEEIKASSDYLLKVRRGDLAQDFRKGGFSDNDLQHTYPVLMKLLEYASLNLESNSSTNYDYMLEAGRGNSKHTFELSLNHPKIFEGLIESYVTMQKGSERHELFSKKIADMTGYNLQIYLREIGLIK